MTGLLVVGDLVYHHGVICVLDSGGRDGGGNAVVCTEITGLLSLGRFGAGGLTF